MQSLFIDTSFILAVYNCSDQYHEMCVEAIETTREAKGLYTTAAILMEIGNAFSAVDRRTTGGKIIRTLLSDPKIECIHLSPAYFEKALKLFEKNNHE